MYAPKGEGMEVKPMRTLHIKCAPFSKQKVAYKGDWGYKNIHFCVRTKWMTTTKHRHYVSDIFNKSDRESVQFKS